MTDAQPSGEGSCTTLNDIVAAISQLEMRLADEVARVRERIEELQQQQEKALATQTTMASEILKTLALIKGEIFFVFLLLGVVAGLIWH